MIQDDTIIALSSGALPAGIAVLRISGPSSRRVLERLAGGVPPIRQASLRRLRNEAGEALDHGLVLFFESPATVTGEDLAEIHLHGGRAVVAACLDAALGLPGVRLAEAGEFTRRAFENGRIDLTEAEGLADLLRAETEAQRVQAVSQAGGSLRALYEGWMQRLVRARALLEASFDFADEGDVASDVAEEVVPKLHALMAEMRDHLASARRGEILREGFSVAIIGPPNAGKSSLLNALADRDAAIVSDIPGTTRDLIEVSMDLGGLRVRLIDTAGLRETADQIETLGIERARAAAAKADLVLSLSEDAIHVKHSEESAAAGEPSRGRNDVQPVWYIDTKADLGKFRFGRETETGPRPLRFAVSTVDGSGITELVEALAAAARDAAGNPADLVPARTRHRDIVQDALKMLDDSVLPGQPAEITAEHLRRVTDRLGALTGRVGVEDLLDLVFSEFCIGK